MRPCAALNAKKKYMYSGSILKCFNFDDYGLWLMKIRNLLSQSVSIFNSKFACEWRVFLSLV